jgi:preprotein translocase subunit YajC
MATILLQTGGSPLGGLLIPLAFLAIFYFILIVPQRREQKRHRELIAALKKGDRVVTSGGMIGEIIGIKKDQVRLKSGDARVVVERGKIAGLVGTDPVADGGK